VRRPISWRRVVQASLAALWVVWAVASWWTAPREADPAQARADLAAGRIQSYQYGDSWNGATGFSWNHHPSLRSWSSDGPLLVWTTPGGRVHYTTTDDVAGEDSGTDAELLRRDLLGSEAGRGVPTGALAPLTSMSGVLILAFIAILGFGPAPVIGTRWFWFWVVIGVPLGFGFVFWLARERPWRSAATDFSEGGDRRRRWYAGFAIGIATTFGASVLAFVLNGALGEWLIPAMLLG
jgi:hypothetical protein